MAGRAKVPEELERLTKSQRLTVIDEAALGFENTVIARRTLIDHWVAPDDFILYCLTEYTMDYNEQLTTIRL